MKRTVLLICFELNRTIDQTHAIDFLSWIPLKRLQFRVHFNEMHYYCLALIFCHRRFQW